jgi:uncharacterized damage-inducible protein DinB
MHPMLALFRRNAWASEQLLDFCAKQPAEVVKAPASGDVYGAIDAQFAHIVLAETGYLPWITGERRESRISSAKPPQLDEMREPMHWAAERWQGALDFRRDPETVFMIQRRSGPAAMTDWLALLQALHHGDDHRAQIGTLLGRHHIDGPELDLWSFYAANAPESSAGNVSRRDVVLRRAFGHHIWATDELLKRCADLSPQQLALTAPGTYGLLLDTMDHLVSADRSYLSRLRGTGRQPALNAGAVEPLQAQFAQSGADWLAYLDSHADYDEMIMLRDGDQVPAWVILSQAIHHGNDHRTHAGTVLMHHGITYPELDPWEYGSAIGALQIQG